MSHYGKVEFEKEVDKAYDILWEMFSPKGGCNWDTGKEEKLRRILNFIDDELGR